MHLTVFSNHNEQSRFEFHLKSKISVTRCIEWRVRVRISKFDSNLKRNFLKFWFRTSKPCDGRWIILSHLETWVILKHLEPWCWISGWMRSLLVSNFESQSFPTLSSPGVHWMLNSSSPNYLQTTSKVLSKDSLNLIQTESFSRSDLSRSFQWNLSSEIFPVKPFQWKAALTLR